PGPRIQRRRAGESPPQLGSEARTSLDAGIGAHWRNFLACRSPIPGDPPRVVGEGLAPPATRGVKRSSPFSARSLPAPPPGRPRRRTTLLPAATAPPPTPAPPPAPPPPARLPR